MLFYQGWVQCPYFDILYDNNSGKHHSIIVSFCSEVFGSRFSGEWGRNVKGLEVNKKLDINIFFKNIIENSCLRLPWLNNTYFTWTRESYSLAVVRSHSGQVIDIISRLSLTLIVFSTLKGFWVLKDLLKFCGPENTYF